MYYKITIIYMGIFQVNMTIMSAAVNISGRS